jgi:succinyl-CoA synthetase alpha subunit
MGTFIALAKAEKETSVAKNKALSEAGALVPSNFFEFGVMIKKVCSISIETMNNAQTYDD